MQDALAQRKQLWERIKGDYIKAMNAIGFKTSEKFKRESYYRHQILMYANELEHGVAGHRPEAEDSDRPRIPETAPGQRPSDQHRSARSRILGHGAVPI
jgi:hypothetical protein